MIVCMDSCDIGLGPKSKTTIFSRELESRGHKVIRPDVSVADSPRHLAKQVLEEAGGPRADIFFAVMSPGLAAYARDIGKKR